MKAFIHAGYPKCASTTVQWHFAENFDANVEHGLLYPHSYRLKSLYRNHDPLLVPDMSWKTAVEDFVEEAKKAECDRLLISCEALGSERGGRRQGLLKALREHPSVEDITLIVLLRDPFDMLLSTYAQFLIGGVWGVSMGKFHARTEGTIDAWIDAFRAERGCDWYEYDKILATTIDKLELDSLRVWRIDDGEDLIGRFETLLDLPQGVRGGKQNPRMSYSNLLLLRDFQRRFGQKEYLANRKTLMNRFTFEHSALEKEEAIALGLTLERETVEARFADLYEPLPRALAMGWRRRARKTQTKRAFFRLLAPFSKADS